MTGEGEEESPPSAEYGSDGVRRTEDGGGSE